MDLLFSSLSIKRLSYLILVALVVWFLKSFTHNPEAYWMLWSAFLLSLITTGDSFKRRFNTIIITGITAAFVAFISAWLVGVPLLLAIFVFLVTLLCIYYGQLKPAFFIQACIINLFAILSGSDDINLAGNLDRFNFICAGTAIAAFLQIVFYPYFIRNELQPYLGITLNNLKKLNKEIFSCFLDPEYSENIYLYERRVHERKTRFLLSMDRLREITWLAETRLSEAEKGTHEWWLSHLDMLFENMMDYSQLRRRVTDYNTFSVCSQELKSICTEIDKCIEAVIAHIKRKKFFINTQQLSHNIGQLENNYHHVLQVASREPFVFLIFIDSLNEFTRKLEALYAYAVPASSRLS